MECYGGNLKGYELELCTRTLEAEADVLKQMGNLRTSGFPIVLTQALYAIVGAVALQRGGEVANEVVRGKIMLPLGLQ